MDRRDSIELLDDPTLPVDVVARAYRALARTNRWLGNSAAVLRHLRDSKRPIKRVLDIGCGQGSLLEEIRRKLGVEVVGIDLRPAPDSAAVPILIGDAVADPLPVADVAVAVCMAHHLSEGDLIRLIHNVSRSCHRLVLLDLVRHRLPLILFRTFLCPFLPPINVADGMTSIRRAYTPKELREIVDTAVQGSGAQVQLSVAPFYIRQIVDICW